MSDYVKTLSHVLVSGRYSEKMILIDGNKLRFYRERKLKKISVLDFHDIYLGIQCILATGQSGAISTNYIFICFDRPKVI